MPFTPDDTRILRDLAKQIADIAALPVHPEKLDMWTRLNKLQKTRPLISIFQIPWEEMNVDDELTLRTEDPWARGLEWGMRETLYKWNHVRDDLLVEGVVYCPYAISDTGFGIAEESDVNTESGLASRSFHHQIETLADVEKIKLPEISHDEAETERRFEALSELFDGILPVVKRGVTGYWFAPWDLLITWYGVEKAMLDMVLQPELVNAAMERLVDAYMHRLARWEQLNLLSLSGPNDGAGSGGLCATDELPQPGFDPARITPRDLWGCATPQIFSEVSPEMHWEFALRHEIRWLERWGLTYYGCCEPLHTKMGILREIPNLRKVSVSPKCDKVRIAAELRGRYVASLKPNPAIVAMTSWAPELAREELRRELRELDGCAIEIILKDISTVCHEPHRLWEWAQLAQEVAAEFGE